MIKEEGLCNQNIHASKDFIGSIHTLKKHDEHAKIGTAIAEMNGTINNSCDKRNLGRLKWLIP